MLLKLIAHTLGLIPCVMFHCQQVEGDQDRRMLLRVRWLYQRVNRKGRNVNLLMDLDDIYLFNFIIIINLIV